MAADIKNALGIDIELIRSGGGVFEVKRDNVLIFSKKALGRFPTTEEIVKKLQ
ncbi:Rdx family protein [candidate division KSB1 bacterium]|nr:Rdx family protein [candidate division KSB1 bacterium]